MQQNSAAASSRKRSPRQQTSRRPVLFIARATFTSISSQRPRAARRADRSLSNAETGRRRPSITRPARWRISNGLIVLLQIAEAVHAGGAVTPGAARGAVEARLRSSGALLCATGRIPASPCASADRYPCASMTRGRRIPCVGETTPCAHVGRIHQDRQSDRGWRRALQGTASREFIP